MVDPEAFGGERSVAVPPGFSLARTCAPVAWGGNRWPNVAWRDGALTWVGWEGSVTVWRTARPGAPGRLLLSGSATPAHDAAWVRSVLGTGERCPSVADPVIASLHAQFRGLHPYAAGSIYEGLVTAIIGQSISVASAAVTEGRVAALVHPGLELAERRFWPLPRPESLAVAEPALLRGAGVTWRRAEALVGAARATLAGGVPDREAALADPDAARAALRALPLVGPWTAESTLLWGIGFGDAHPTGDVALLRAARLAYGDPTLDLRGLDRLSESWRPGRAWAARFLWTSLLGEAPASPP